MRILITGGNGQLGVYITSLLLKQGHTIGIYDKVFDNEYLSPTAKSQIQYIQGDLMNPTSIYECVSQFKPEIIYHLAGLLSLTSEANPQETVNVNGIGTFYVLEAARLFKVRQVIFVSTLLTFDKDIQKHNIDEFTLQRPSTIYGINKLYGELLGCYYKEKYGLDFRAIRLSTVIGPEAKIRHISIFNIWMIEKSFFGKACEVFVPEETISPLIYYKDAANALIQLSDAPLEQIKAVCYNVSSYRVSAKEMAEHVKRGIPNAKITFNPDAEIIKLQKSRGPFIYDCSKALQEWGWKPTYTLEEMVIDFCNELEKSKYTEIS